MTVPVASPSTVTAWTAHVSGVVALDTRYCMANASGGLDLYDHDGPCREMVYLYRTADIPNDRPRWVVCPDRLVLVELRPTV